MPLQITYKYRELSVFKPFAIYMFICGVIGLYLHFNLEIIGSIYWLIDGSLTILLSILLYYLSTKPYTKAITYVLAIWFIHLLAFGYYMVDDNIIGTNINFRLLALVLFLSYLLDWHKSISLVIITIVNNFIQVIGIQEEWVQPIIYHNPTFIEFFQIQLMGFLIISISSKVHKWSDIEIKKVERRRERLLSINSQYDSTNLELVNNIFSFKQKVTKHLNKIGHWLRLAKQFLNNTDHFRDRSKLEVVKNYFDSIDSIIRHIEKKSNDQLIPTKVYKEKSRKLSRDTFIKLQKGIHDRSFLMYISLLIISAHSLLMPEAEYRSITLVIMISAIILSLFYALYEWNPELIFSLGLGVLTSILIFLHLHLSSLNGIAHVIQMGEFMLCLFIAFRYGSRLGMMSVSLFILYSVFVHYIIQNEMWQPLIQFDPEPKALVSFFGLSAISFMLLAKFSVNRYATIREYLKELQYTAQKRRSKLSKTYRMHRMELDTINKLSIANSHELRAPVANIIGLISLLIENTSDPSSQMILQSNIEKSIKKVESTLAEYKFNSSL